MPVTLTPGVPTGVIGWGVGVLLQTSLIGPLPTDTIWELDYFADADRTQLIGAVTGTGNANPRTLTIGSYADNAGHGPASLQIGQLAYLEAKVMNSSEVVLDSGIASFTWAQTTADLEQLQLDIQHFAVGQGLSTIQGQQLQDLHDATFPSQLLDTLTLAELPADPLTGFVGADLPSPVFGIIVRISHVPSTIGPSTPDGDYWFPDLAVVRIYRGSDLWIRRPIHTSSAIVQLLDQGIVSAVAALTATQWLLNLSLQVSFRPDVSGQVFLMRFP